MYFIIFCYLTPYRCTRKEPRRKSWKLHHELRREIHWHFSTFDSENAATRWTAIAINFVPTCWRRSWNSQWRLCCNSFHAKVIASVCIIISCYLCRRECGKQTWDVGKKHKLQSLSLSAVANSSSYPLEVSRGWRWLRHLSFDVMSGTVEYDLFLCFTDTQ